MLYVICRRVPNPMCRALANDHRNDVVSNTAAVACGIIGQICLLDRNKIMNNSLMYWS